MSRSKKMVQMALAGVQTRSKRRTNYSADDVAESPCPPVDEESFEKFKQILQKRNNNNLVGSNDSTSVTNDGSVSKVVKVLDFDHSPKQTTPSEKESCIEEPETLSTDTITAASFNLSANSSGLELLSQYDFTDSDTEGEDETATSAGVTTETAADLVVAGTLPKIVNSENYAKLVGCVSELVNAESLDVGEQRIEDGNLEAFSPVLADDEVTSIVFHSTPIALPYGEGSIIYSEPLLETSYGETVSNDLMSSSDPEGMQEVLTLPLNESVSPKPKSRSRNASASKSPVRKRSRNEALWGKNVSKALKNSGLPYVSSNGKKFEGAKMRGPCSCSLDCVHRITQEQRQEIHNQFWQIGHHDRQWEFIRVNSKSNPTKPGQGNQALKRKVSRSYYFNVDGELKRICKQMFMRTLGICDSWIESAYSHINPDKGFTVSPDKRGRHKNKITQMTPEKIESVKVHVNLFPRVPSHYCRKRSKREYLEKGLSISKMAQLYAKWTVDKNLPKTSIATKRQYRDIVNNNFNIAFFKPKKDQCSLCCLMRNKSNTREIRETRKTMWVTHLDNKKKSRALKEKDKIEGMKDKTIAVCSFDLQKQLTCPKSEDSAMYYRSKLNLYNFTIFNHIERIGTCFIWHEGIGKKGSSEISSALNQGICELVKKGHTDIRFYSDNCAGQNKNRFLFAMYLHLSVKYSIKITHRYLEPGHTQMEADSIHGNIERSTEKMDIYDFDGWIEAIEQAKEQLPKYNVKRLHQNNIFCYKSLVRMQNCDVDLKRQPIAWKKVKEIFINGQEEGNFVRVKYDYSSEAYVTMSPNKRGHPINLKTYKPPLAYTSNIPLSTNTIKDLTYLCDNLHVPLLKQTFLRNVLAGVNPIEEEEVSDLEYESDEEMCNADNNAEANVEGNDSQEEDNNLE